MCYGITLLIKGVGGEWDMCVLDYRCMCGSTVGVWRRAVGPADIRLLQCGMAEGRSRRGKHEGVEGRVWRNRGAIRGNRGVSVGKQEGRERMNRGASMRKQRGGRGGTEGIEERGWDVLRAVWGEVGGHGVMVRGCDGAVDTAAVWFPVV